MSQTWCQTAHGHWLWFVQTEDGRLGIYRHPTDGGRLLAEIPPEAFDD